MNYRVLKLIIESTILLVTLMGKVFKTDINDVKTFTTFELA